MVGNQDEYTDGARLPLVALPNVEESPIREGENLQVNKSSFRAKDNAMSHRLISARLFALDCQILAFNLFLQRK